MRKTGEWGATFVVAVPALTEYSATDSKQAVSAS